MMSIDSAGPLAALLHAGWQRHDTESEPLAAALEAAAEGGVPDASLEPFLHLSLHTIGEHLGDWPRALALGRRVLDGRTPAPQTARAWARLSIAAALAGEVIEAIAIELGCLNAAGDDRDIMLLDMRFMLIAALVATKRAGEAARLYRGALDLASRIRPSMQLHRTIAAASNNLAWELYEMTSRTADERALMMLCAETSLASWRDGGSWINVEQAHHLAALVAHMTGEPASALAHADAALGIIAANGDRPLDSALLHLARAAALSAAGDDAGRAAAMADADAAASTLAAADLVARYHAERAKVSGTEA